MDALVPRLDFAALAQSVYLNQAALGLIPAQSLEVMLEHLTQTAQHGNVRLSDEEELRILDELRAAGAILLGTEPGAVAVLGGASAGLATAAALVPAGDVVLVATDFPSVTHPWLAGSASGRSVTWVEDSAGVSLTDSVVDAIRPGVAAVCVSAVMYGTGSRVDCAVLADSARGRCSTDCRRYSAGRRRRGRNGRLGRRLRGHQRIQMVVRTRGSRVVRGR